MQGVSPEKIPAIIAKQVSLVWREALFVITLVEPDGKVEIHENPNGRLGVIAVIGPGTYQGEYFGKAPLLEVGFWRGRPYNKAYGFGGRYCHIRSRQKRFLLTSDQYEVVAPLVFQAIQYLVDRRVAGWKGARYQYWFRRQTNHWNSRQRGVLQKSKRLLIPRYITVTFSTEDSLFLPDIYWAEMNSSIVQRYLTNFAQWIRARIWEYESKQGWKGRVTFERLKGVVDLKRLLAKRFPPLHLKREALLYLPGGRDYSLFKKIAALPSLRWDGEPTKESLFSHEAQNPKLRLDGLQLLVHRHSKKHITCWIYATASRMPPPETEEAPDDDCPF